MVEPDAPPLDDKQHSSKIAGPLPLPPKGDTANAASAQTTSGNVALRQQPRVYTLRYSGTQLPSSWRLKS